MYFLIWYYHSFVTYWKASMDMHSARLAGGVSEGICQTVQPSLAAVDLPSLIFTHSLPWLLCPQASRITCSWNTVCSCPVFSSCCFWAWNVWLLLVHMVNSCLPSENSSLLSPPTSPLGNLCWLRATTEVQVHVIRLKAGTLSCALLNHVWHWVWHGHLQEEGLSVLC